MKQMDGVARRLILTGMGCVVASCLLATVLAYARASTDGLLAVVVGVGFSGGVVLVMMGSLASWFPARRRER